MDPRPKHEISNTEAAGRKHRQHLHDVGVGKVFLNKTPLAQKVRPMNNTQDFMKLKRIRTAKDPIN